MAIFGFHDRPCIKAFEAHCDELLSEYLDRIKTQVLKWFGNIKRQPLDIVAAVDKTLITSQPEDMFNIIHVQVEVAKEKMPAERLKDVVNACLQVSCRLSINVTHLLLIILLNPPSHVCRFYGMCSVKTTINCHLPGDGWILVTPRPLFHYYIPPHFPSHPITIYHINRNDLFHCERQPTDAREMRRVW